MDGASICFNLSEAVPDNYGFAFTHAINNQPNVPTLLSCKRKLSATVEGGPPSSTRLSARLKRARNILLAQSEKQLSNLEASPAEVIQNIAAQASDDQDLTNLILASRKLAFHISPDDSLVWKVRFLARYDHPIIDSSVDYGVAYKLRRLVLNPRNFVDFRNGKDERLEIQLETVKDMILETFHRHKPWLPAPVTSKNLACLSSPGTSSWILKLLSSPFFGYGHESHGTPNALFDAIQLTLSHLVLSPRSRCNHAVKGRSHCYDVLRIYQFEQPLSLLYREIPDEDEDEADGAKLYKSKIFPNLGRDDCRPRLRTRKFDLDLYTLLHIRNFWYRHLTDVPVDINSQILAKEGTYADLSSKLWRLDRSPKPWTGPLQDSQVNLEGILRGLWYGHYACVHPWPKKKADWDAKHACAEDWDDISPFKLDLGSNTDNEAYAWPPIFSTIPIFENTIYKNVDSIRPMFYIRGLACFLDTNSDRQECSTTAAIRPRKSFSTVSTPQFHPYLSMRVRGVIHPIDDYGEIPGWHRVVMVLFKPRSHYLISVLAHAEEDYGSSFTMDGLSQSEQVTVQAIMGGASDLEPAEEEKYLKNWLKKKLHEEAYKEEMMSKEVIEELENGYCGSEWLRWEDVEYAYAYEGVIIPGGNVMMGRWWRIGEAGLGDGKEVDCEGQSVVRNLEEPGSEDEVESGENARRATKGLERGVFCFWA